MSAAWLAYIGALSAAWASMGLFCLRTATIRNVYGWAPLSRRGDILWGVAACVSCAASLLLMLRVDGASFALILWFVLLASSGVAFAVLLPFWTQICRRSLGVAALVAIAGGLMLELM